MERLILIKNGVITTADFGNTIHKEGAILIGGNAIADLEFIPEVEKRNSGADRVIDAKKEAVIPGLIDTHTSLIGSLENGKHSSIVIINLNTLHTAPLMKGNYNNVVPRLVYSSSGSDVEAVFVDGYQLMENWKLVIVDEQEGIDGAQAAAEEIFRLKEPMIPK